MKSRVANESLAEVLDRHTTAAAPELVRAEGDRLRCLACGHRCLIGDGLRGTCKVRFNDAGTLKVPHGYVAGLQCDPVEKKPFFHVYPGSDALTFGMMGCDLHCGYCQNWLTSQALRDASAVAPIRPVTPAQLIDVARREGAKLVVSSYNEPLITAEWAVDVFREAGRAGIACGFVSNGNATPEVLDYLKPWIVAYKVDLKSFRDRNYRSLGGALENITRTIRMVYERGLWLEVVTLVVPGFNDSEEELRDIARFLASVSPDIPWHVTAFHQDYRMTDPDATSAATLVRACEIGTEEGLRFVYAGNLPGRVGPWENTRCPSCRATLIERYGYLIRGYHVTPEGRCPHCSTQLPGVWPANAGEVRTGNDRAAYLSRLPRRVGVAQDVQPLETSRLSDREARTHPPLATDPSPQPGATMSTAESPAAATALTDEQKARLVAGVADMLRDIVVGSPAALPEKLSELADVPLSGAFVSLKRGKHLRSCCGIVGRTVSLRQALERAADRAIWEDERFPPVSANELEHLDLEVWLLRNPERVSARGEERASAIEVGRHGVKVVRGQANGLFLPSVAAEHSWDARRFLDQVCVKAGLPPTAWLDDDTEVYTFEGEVVRGNVATPDGPRQAGRLVGPCRAEDVATFAALCRDNLAALLAGASPRYFWGAPDGQVNGVLLFLHRPGRNELRQFSRYSLRPGLPLQSTLFSLLQAAAQDLAALGPTGDESWQLGLMFLHDPVLHGTVADAQLAGFEPHRAVLVLERGKTGLAFDPEKPAAELLEAAARAARVTKPESAGVYSLDAVSNVNRVMASTAPVPARGPAVRPAAVAGQFYDADADALGRLVDRILGHGRRQERWPAAMVPHAGLKFSGRVAAEVLRRIRFPKTVIAIGPKHTPLGCEWAVAPHQTWAIPGGGVASDPALARKLCDAIPGLELDAAAHLREHGTEVELPLISRLAPDTKVVGIALGHGDLESCRRFAEGLASVVRGMEEKPLLLISSDMNHFANDADTRRLDALALAALETGDPAKLYGTVTDNNISMCGVLPAVIVLETLRLLDGFHKAERVAYATSADTTGDTSRVVGYAGVLLG